jgi:hypothetical protein
VGPVQVLAARLHFDQQDAGPEQVDVAGAAAVLLHRMLETGNALVGDPEDLEEGDQERLALAVLVAGVGPVLGERQGARLNFVPGNLTVGADGTATRIGKTTHPQSMRADPCSGSGAPPRCQPSALIFRVSSCRT